MCPDFTTGAFVALFFERGIDMSISQNEKLNTVSSANQMVKGAVKILKNDGKYRVLFIGNSITWHGPKADIGWHGDWGMAASKEENDYVHVLVSMLQESGDNVDYCIAQLAEWERDYERGLDILNEKYALAREFGADLVIVRIGENMPKGSAPASKDRFAEMIGYFVTKPTTRVIVTDSFWQNDPRDNMIREIAQERGYTFCHLCDLEKDPKTMAIGQFEHRGVSVHPSDYGMEMIARRLFDAIKG